MGDGGENISKKGADERGCFTASKSCSHFKRHRVQRWKDTSLVSIEVDPNDDKTLKYIASKVFEQMRSLHSKPGKTYAHLGSIYDNLYLLAKANHLILFRNTRGRNIGVLAFDIGIPWYTHYTCFSEVFVLGLDPSFYGFGRVALQYMKKKAKDLGCSLMETGASMTDDPKMIENLYKRHGKCNFMYSCFVWTLPITKSMTGTIEYN